MCKIFLLALLSFSVLVKCKSFHAVNRLDNSHRKNYFNDYSSNLSVLLSDPTKYEHNEAEYDYDNLIQEYKDDNTNETYITTKKRGLFIKHISKIILMNEVSKIYSVPIDKVGKTKTLVLIETWKYFRRVVKTWVLIYLVIAIPLWCIKGWCCCCLFCHVFKPQRTIDEAKKYLVTNPPGVLKLRNDEIYYNPTDYEKEAYEKLEHMLRTI